MLGRCGNKGFRVKMGLTCPNIDLSTLDGAKIWHTFAWWGAPTLIPCVF